MDPSTVLPSFIFACPSSAAADSPVKINSGLKLGEETIWVAKQEFAVDDTTPATDLVDIKHNDGRRK